MLCTEMPTDARFEGNIVKVDAERRMAFGWAYVAKRADGSLPLDTGGEGTEPGHIDLVDTDEAVAAMESAFYKYSRDHRTADIDHEHDTPAQLVELVVFTPDKVAKMGLPDGIPTGVWAGWYFPDTDEGNRALAEAKQRRGLSIVGRGKREKL